MALLAGACAGGTEVVPAASMEPGPDTASEYASGPGGGDSAIGQILATERNCISCHSADGSPGVGPSWRERYGTVGELVDGSTVVVDRSGAVVSPGWR